MPQPRSCVLLLASTALLRAAGPLPLGKVPPGKVFLVILPHHDDHTDEKDGYGLTPEEAALRNTEESRQAARILGVKEVISLGYRAGELAAVSPTELRDRVMFYIRHYRPQVLFVPNPYTHYDDNLDHYYAGSAVEEARWAAALRNFQPPFSLAGLGAHRVPELYYYALPVDPRHREPETTAAFSPQPKVVDIAGSFDRKLQAIQALRTVNRSLAIRIQDRLAATGRRLTLLDNITEESVNGLIEIRVRNLAREAAAGTNLSLAEEFHYTPPQKQ